jgi:purine-cytosine permease-like protein
LIIVSLVVFGMTLLTKLQVWTQPPWLLMLFAPPVAVLMVDPHTISQWTSFAGTSPSGAKFDWLLLGSAAGIAPPLIAEIGEQADYLRFMPEAVKPNRTRWWIVVICADPGWVILGAAKQLLGSLFAAVAVALGTPAAQAGEPIQMC